MIESHPDILRIIEHAHSDGWVLEPDAKRLFSLAGFTVPHFIFARTTEDALTCAHEIGYPVVAKVVSPRILHKSDVDGVALGISDDEGMTRAFERFRVMDGFLGVLVEEMLPGGIELILGAKIDLQFGPMILLGMGGTGVEIYQDVALRMAPLTEKDVLAMIKGLKARRLLEGYRGAEPVDQVRLTETILAFSTLVMELKGRIESIDINPLLCSVGRCMVADARIILGR
jgi:acetate---CoA ligase (ADP-forming) subunit beta